MLAPGKAPQTSMTPTHRTVHKCIQAIKTLLAEITQAEPYHDFHYELNFQP